MIALIAGTGALVACGQPVVEISITDESGATRAPASFITATTDAILTDDAYLVLGADDVTESRFDVVQRVAEAFLTQHRMPDANLANYVVSNRERFRLFSVCMAESGYGGVDLGPAEPIVTSSMVIAPLLPLRWSAPPTGLIDVSHRVSKVEPTKESTEEWKPPNLSADELQRFEQTLNDCDSNAPFPSPIDDDLVMTLLAGMVAIAEAAMKSPGFAEVDASYRDCMTSHGLSVGEYVRDEIVLPGTATQEAMRETDSACQLPLYERFIQIDVDAWNQWLDTNDTSLKRLREMGDNVLSKLVSRSRGSSERTGRVQFIGLA